MVYVSTKKVIAFILSIVLLAFVGCKSAGKKKRSAARFAGNCA
jgi:hypothetical protein